MKKLSNDFKRFFLLYFTKELILHSVSGEIMHLQELTKEQVKEEKEELIHSIRKKIPELKKGLKEKDLDFNKIFRNTAPLVHKKKRVLIIPEPKLPPHLQYLKPFPVEINIDLEKLNSLMKDPAVKVIECNGPDEHITVQGTMGTKPTNIVLNKEEINRIIRKFSELSRIPVNEGIYRVVVGRYIFSAIISEVVGSKFMIKKMVYAPTFKGQKYPNPRIR